MTGARDYLARRMDRMERLVKRMQALVERATEKLAVVPGVEGATGSREVEEAQALRVLVDDALFEQRKQRRAGRRCHGKAQSRRGGK